MSALPPLSCPLDGAADPCFNTSLGLGKDGWKKISRWDAVESLKFVKVNPLPILLCAHILAGTSIKGPSKLVRMYSFPI